MKAYINEMAKNPFERLPAAEIRDLNLVGRDIVNAAFNVHKALGPGLLEAVYTECLVYELVQNRSLRVQREVELPIKYDGQMLKSKLRLDLLVEGSVIVEVKAVEQMNPLFQAQLLTYLRVSELHLGFLINFNVPLIKNGIKRMVI